MSEIDIDVFKGELYPKLKFTITPDGSRVGACGDVQNPADAEDLTDGLYIEPRLKRRVSYGKMLAEGLQMNVLKRLQEVRA